MNITDLINAGFTYEELFNKGILVAKEPQPQPDPQTDPQPQPDPQLEPDPQPAPDNNDPNNAVLEAINNLASNIQQAMQALNRQNAVRGQQQGEQMTLEDAITGLYKGV